MCIYFCIPRLQSEDNNLQTTKPISSQLAARSHESITINSLSQLAINNNHGKSLSSNRSLLDVKRNSSPRTSMPDVIDRLSGGDYRTTNNRLNQALQCQKSVKTNSTNKAQVPSKDKANDTAQANNLSPSPNNNNAIINRSTSITRTFSERRQLTHTGASLGSLRLSSNSKLMLCQDQDPKGQLSIRSMPAVVLPDTVGSPKACDKPNLPRYPSMANILPNRNKSKLKLPKCSSLISNKRPRQASITTLSRRSKMNSPDVQQFATIRSANPNPFGNPTNKNIESLIETN